MDSASCFSSSVLAHILHFNFSHDSFPINMAIVPIVMDNSQLYLPTSSYSRVVISLVALTASYLAALIIYRLFFSPLAGFPGPKIAAVTGFYETYYDFVLNGQYVFKIKEMHERYGQSVRMLNQRSPQQFFMIRVETISTQVP